jgi:pimeloyl-ACP methyl ester carboxylesterase
LDAQAYRVKTAFMIFAAPLGMLALALVVGAAYQMIGTLWDRRSFAPPGRLLRFNKRRMHIHVTGEGTPTVVFESGMGASCLSWTRVQPEVAQFSRAVSYDRAGHGWSDLAREPRTAQQIALELHALLGAAGVPGPYVLVGHSFGGYVVRAFAHIYHDDVAGIVLVDSIHPAEWESPSREQLRMIQMGVRYAWIAAWLARLGLVRLCLERVARGSPGLAWAATRTFGAGVSSAVQRIAGEIRKLPAPILPVVRGLWSQPKNFLSLGQHVAALPVSAAQAAAANSLGDLPLVVVSGDHHPAPYADWQRDLAQLSSRGAQLVAGDSGHWIHLDRPELVTQVIREVVSAARSTPQTESSTRMGRR